LAPVRAVVDQYRLRVMSGHPGSITSIHAGSPEQAFEQLALLVKGSEAGRQLTREDILNLAHQVIDVVIQLECHHGQPGGRLRT
jgi:type IV secretion system protein VirB11